MLFIFQLLVDFHETHQHREYCWVFKDERSWGFSLSKRWLKRSASLLYLPTLKVSEFLEFWHRRFANLNQTAVPSALMMFLTFPTSLNIKRPSESVKIYTGHTNHYQTYSSRQLDFHFGINERRSKTKFWKSQAGSKNGLYHEMKYMLTSLLKSSRSGRIRHTTTFHKLYLPLYGTLQSFGQGWQLSH